MNVVPLPSWLSNVTVLPSASVSRLTTAKPKPCPLDFVVNNGWNNFALALSGVPEPVSEKKKPYPNISWKNGT